MMPLLCLLFSITSCEDLNYTRSFRVHLHGPDYCVTVKCCLFLHSDRGVLLLCSACLLDLFSFSLFSVLTVCSGPALGNTRSYKLLDWNSVTAGISSPFYCSHPKERWQLSEVNPQPIASTRAQPKLNICILYGR